MWSSDDLAYQGTRLRHHGLGFCVPDFGRSADVKRWWQATEGIRFIGLMLLLCLVLMAWMIFTFE